VLLPRISRTATYHPPVHERERFDRPATARGRHVQRRPDQAPQEPLLDLQRQVGNQAFTLLVQRAPGDRPAPTDAPGKRKPKPPKKSPPAKKAEDIRARIIKYETLKGEGVITIAAGTDQGVKVGMAGSLLGKDGAEVADFVIEKVGGTSVAHIKATQDQVSANPYVIIKASQFEDVDLTGKEF
jgi:hypothetical protein